MVAKPLMQQPFKGLKREREKNICGPEVDVKYKYFVTAFNAQKRWPRVHEPINSRYSIIFENCLCLLFLLQIIVYIVITYCQMYKIRFDNKYFYCLHSTRLIVY